MKSLFQGTVLNYGYSLRGQERLKVLESLLSRQLQRPEMIENMHFGFAKVHQRTNRLIGWGRSPASVAGESIGLHETLRGLWRTGGLCSLFPQFLRAEPAQAYEGLNTTL